MIKELLGLFPKHVAKTWLLTEENGGSIQALVVFCAHDNVAVIDRSVRTIVTLHQHVSLGHNNAVTL